MKVLESKLSSNEDRQQQQCTVRGRLGHGEQISITGQRYHHRSFTIVSSICFFIAS